MSEEPDSTAEKDDDVEVVEVVLEVGETAAASWGASRGNSVAIRRSATIFDRDNDMDDQAMNLHSPTFGRRDSFRTSCKGQTTSVR